jgi:hypothetical protein
MAAPERCSKLSDTPDRAPEEDSIADIGRRPLVRGKVGGAGGVDGFAGKTNGGFGRGLAFIWVSTVMTGPMMWSVVASLKPCPTVAWVGISGPQAKAIISSGRAAAVQKDGVATASKTGIEYSRGRRGAVVVRNDRGRAACACACVRVCVRVRRRRRRASSDGVEIGCVRRDRERQ